MNMAVRCTVCLSQHRNAVDMAVASGQPRALVATTYGLSVASIARHLRAGHSRNEAHRPPALLPASKRPAPETSPREHAQRIVDGLAVVDTATMSPRERALHADQYRKAVETLGRMPGNVKVTEAEDKVRVFTDILAAYDTVLDAHPEVARDVAAALHAMKAGRKP